jgi:flagellin
MTAQIRGSQQASRNANDGISLAQTAEGSLNEVANNLQRIRELAIQSANATNSASDRAGLQAEVGQLLSEIDRVASSASFNGVKLLDGSFTSQQFQVGANATADDRITVSSISSARITSLGASTTYSTTLGSGGTVNSSALASGDLILNGFTVGASAATGAGQTTDSAYAKAAAINALTSSTNVTATAGAASAAGAAATATVVNATPATNTATNAAGFTKTTVVGAEITTFASPANDITAGDLQVEGVSLGAIAGAGSSTLQADAIVSAFDAAKAGGGGAPLANITATKVAVGGGFGVNLVDSTGASVTITLGASADAANTGFTAGATAANTIAGTVSGDLTVNGSSVVVTDTVNATLATAQAAHAAKISAAVAALDANYSATLASDKVVISRADGANFTVVADTEGQASSGFVGTTTTTDGVVATNTYSSITAGDLTINGISVGAVSATTTAAQRGIDLAAAINTVSSTSGVTATVAASGALSLTAADGRNITVALSGTATTASTGLTAATDRGTLTLASTDAAGITVGGTTPANAVSGLATTAATATFNGGLSLLSIATVAGANTALATVDAALATVNSSRADLGAIQNRFSSVVSSLGSTVENLTASRSRIMDTDFAAETASLTRGQILQQAGTAMLAQANQLPNTVLSLLR